MSAASEILSIPEVRARVSLVSVAQYHRLAEFDEAGSRTELIRGIVIEKMSKSPLHSSIARRLFKLLQELIPEGFTLLREDPLTFSDSEPEPDLAVVRGMETEFVDKHPSTAELVIEIAVSSAVLDREKASVYAVAGVKEYWIILATERRVEIYRAPEAGSYRELSVAEGDAVLECAALPGVRVPLAELFA
ncbi:Uma2 family endonuclease [Luteolibacter sp. Populi]|uniref:Uma2 family endonuclease n=1 Tax=Luteolibacter sp. Populi TaxID=3230487 RepID=UPI0034663BB7